MLNIPEVIKELFLQDGIRKNFRVHFPNGERADLVNKDIIEESVRFTESTCSQQTLRFGLTEASVIEFECVGVENIAGMTIECAIEIDVSSLKRADREAYGTRTDDVPFLHYAVPYGVFVVDKCPRQADMKRRKVTGYTEAGVAGISVGIAGKNRTLRISVESLIEASWLREEDFEDGQQYTDYKVNGGANANGILAELWPGSGYDLDQKICRFILDAEDKDARIAVYLKESDPIDLSITDALMTRLMASIPAGYVRDPSNAAITIASNSAQAFYGLAGGLYTTATLRVVSATARTISYPLMLKDNAINVIDLKQLRALPIYGTAIPDANIVNLFLDIRTITSLPPYYFWTSAAAAVPVDCSDILPLTITRDVTIKVKRMDDGGGAQEFNVNATGEVTLPSLGLYYAFLDDTELRDLLGAALEVRGSFGSVQRNGKTVENVLNRNNQAALSLSSIESVWYDEGATTPPGAVLFKYQNQTEEFTGELVFRDGPTYDMTGNKALADAVDRSQAAIVTAITDRFPQNTQAAFYTPADIKMKGLPWLKDGDAIRIELEDGETVDTYILRHTISGVQHLVDDIEAQGEV